ncbi:Neurobeachin-like protein 2 [Rhizoclosmatium sp. JEL0117]|nr:Neurobeachin-like protein 2 [Rhizoclosmatium sp. JEL0117]
MDADLPCSCCLLEGNTDDTTLVLLTGNEGPGPDDSAHALMLHINALYGGSLDTRISAGCFLACAQLRLSSPTDQKPHSVIAKDPPPKEKDLYFPFAKIKPLNINLGLLKPDPALAASPSTQANLVGGGGGAGAKHAASPNSSFPLAQINNNHPHRIVVKLIADFAAQAALLHKTLATSTSSTASPSAAGPPPTPDANANANANVERLVALKDALTALRCVDILARFEDDADAVVKHGALAAALSLIRLFTTSKSAPEDDPALANVVLNMWRDILCTALALVSRILRGAHRWSSFLKQGKITGSSPLSPTSSVVNGIYEAIIQLLKYVFNDSSSISKSHQLRADIAMASIVTLSIAVVSSLSVQNSLLASPEALALLTATCSKFPAIDPQCVELNLAASHLMVYLSLIAPPEGSQKRVLSDAAGISIVSLLNSITSTPADVLDAKTSNTNNVSKDFEFALSLIEKRQGIQQPLYVEDAVLKILCGEDGGTILNQGVDLLGIFGRCVLGLLIGFCDVRVWVLNSHEAEDDLEVVVSDSEVMSRIRGVTKTLFANTRSEGEGGVLFRLAVIEFLGAVFEVGVNASSEEETNTLNLKRAVCLAVMDQSDAWNELLGSKYYLHPTVNVKHLVLTFIIEAAALPDTSNAGLILNLLQMASDSEAIAMKFVAIRTISAVAQCSRSSMDRTIEALIKLNFLEHLIPIISTASTEDLETLDLAKAMLSFINLISKTSFKAALYISEHPRTRNFLLGCVTLSVKKVSPEFISLGYNVVLALMGTLLSASEKLVNSTTSHSSTEPKSIMLAWINNYMCSFGLQIESVTEIDIHLRLLKGLRSVMKLFPSGSLERGRIRSRLVEAKVLERLVGLFSVKFVDKVLTPSQQVTPLSNPPETPTSPTAISPSFLALNISEYMVRIHSHALMATIGSFLTGSLLANRCFKSISGFDEIKHRLFGAEDGWKMWPGFLNDMIGLLVPKTMRTVPDDFKSSVQRENESGAVLEISNVLVIRNLSVLEPLLIMFGSCDDGMRLRLLDYLEKLANGHEMNRVLMTQAGAVGMLLKNVLSKVEGLEQLEKFIKLFEVVANYSISVAEAKYLFRSLRHFETFRLDTPEHQPQPLVRTRSLSLNSINTPPRSLSRRPSGSLFDGRSNTLCLPFYYDSLLKCVLKLFQRKDPDLDMFYFSGRNSGLILPEVEKWPSPAGYSFIGWIKIQDYTTAAVSTTAASESTGLKMLWSMRAENGDGVELAIVKNVVTLFVYRSGQSYSLAASDIPLISKRWYFINVCHTAPKLPWYANPEATIYINGVPRITAKLPYPDTRAHFFNRIGAGGFVGQLVQTPSRKNFFQPQGVSNDSIPDIGDVLIQDTAVATCCSSFSGQMTCVYLMDDVLSATQVEALFNIGPGHCSQFKSEDLSSFPDVGKILFDGSLNQKIMLQVYPTATRHGSVSSVCYDIGPRHLGDVEMRDVISCSSKCLQTAVHAFGGIEVTFPLISHLNYAIEPIPGNNLKRSYVNPLDPPIVVRNGRLSIFLQIIGLLLANDIAHMERFAVVQGPRILSMLLQQQDATLLNMKSLDAIMAVVKIASEVSLMSPKIAPVGSVLGSLGDELEEYLVFEYRLWALTDLSVQLQHIEFLQHFLLANNETHRSKYGIIFLTDLLEKFYWSVPPDFLPPDVLAKLMLGRVDVAAISKIRESIFKIMSDMVTNAGGMRPEECHRLVNSLWTCRNDPIHILEILKFFIDHCLVSTSNSVLESFLATGAPVEVILWLAFHSDNENVQTSAMKLLLVLLKSTRTPEKCKKKLKLEDFPGSFASSSLTTHQCGSAIANCLAPHRLSRHTYLTLLQLAIEEQIVDWYSDKTVVNLADIPNLTIVNGVFLSAILDLLSKAKHQSQLDKEKLIGTALEDLLFIITRSPGNSEQLRKIYGWQTYLVDLIPIGAQSITPTVQDVLNATSFSEKFATSMLSPVVESPMGPASPNTAFPLSPATSSSYDVILDRVADVFSTAVLDSFVSDRRVWRLVEETLVLVWISKQVDGLQPGMKIMGSILKGMMRKLRFDIQGGVADNNMFTGNTLENTYHLLSLVEEFLFSYQDLYDEILAEVNNLDSLNTSDLGTDSASQLEVLAQKFHLNRKHRQSTGVHVAYPFHENRHVAEECVELIGTLLEFGITHVPLSDTADKAHTRPGGIPRIQLRLLLNALSTGNHEVWSTILPQFMALFEKHGQSFCDGQSKNDMAHVLAQLTDAYKLALKRTDETNSAHPTSKAIFPLFDLVLQQWQDSICQLWKSKDGSTLSKELLEQAEVSLDSFNTLITSSAWQALYDEHFFPGSRKAEEEELEYIPIIKKRYSKIAKPVIQKAGKEALLVSKMTTSLESHLKILHNRRESDAHARLPDVLASQESEKRLTARRWLAMFHQLTQERGIWLPKKVGTSHFQTTSFTGVKWKLDRTENSVRMHKRLIPNFEFDDHKDAAMRRDKSYASRENVAAPETEAISDSSLANMTIAERKKAKVDKLKSHYKLGASNDELRQVSNSMGALNVTEEDLVEEDWDMVNNEEMSSINVDSENFLFSCECEMILLMTAVKGRLELTASNITFFADLRASAANLSESDQKTLVLLAESEVLLRERRWPISKLREIYFRRYKLRNSAVEFFFVDGANCFFNFKTAKPKLRLMTSIIRLKPVNLKVADVRNPVEMIAKSDVTERWQRHEISNFEYLMQLNTISGRTNNDLTQYPVFPWVLTDYKSEKIDLSDPSVYRDLSKPIGALDPARLEQYLQRYESFEDPSGQIKKFMYGTHYSTSAAVLFYMLRMEPFTSLHIALQGGKFDHPDRQFDSIENCWKSVLTGNGDVKELIPEFFYMPEFLVNENDFDLGTKQTGATLNDVVLPPWANTPEEFIKIHREALEGEYVSEHLHEWIDLIWGYKQTGPEAVKANNVFYYLTYEGAINIDQIQDPVERRSIEDQINNFGQTPMQLFKKPHPKRLPKAEFSHPTVFTAGKLENGYSLFVRGVSGDFGYMPYISTTTLIGNHGPTGVQAVAQKGMKAFLSQVEKEKMITVDSTMVVGVHRWSSGVKQNAENPFVFEADGGSLARRRLPCYLASNMTISQHLFAHTKDGRFLFTCGHWDSSFQVISLDNGVNSPPKSIDAIYGHHDIVTCLSLSEDGRMLVTGSRDTTVIAWDLGFTSSDVTVKQDTRRVFYGHDEEVTCVAINTDQDLVVSGSKDGTCIVHALGTSQYLRTIRPEASLTSSTLRFSISKILITRQGLVIHSEESISPVAAVQDFSVCNNNERVEETVAGEDGKAGSSGSLSSNEAVLLNRTHKSHLDVYSVNGKLLKTRQFDGIVGDLVASDDGMHLILIIYVTASLSVSTSGGEGGLSGSKAAANLLTAIPTTSTEAGIVLEKLNSFTLKTIVKQKVEDETLRVEGNEKIETVVHVTSNQACLIIGYRSDKVLVLTV